MDKNPFVYKHWNSITIVFNVPHLAEPLWWTGSGFKNLVKANARPQEFNSVNEAEVYIKNYLIGFINRNRQDQDKNINGIYTLKTLIKIHGDNKKIPKKVFKFSQPDKDIYTWEKTAMEINDDPSINRKSRKLRLINHFKKINIKLSFTSNVKPIKR